MNRIAGIALVAGCESAALQSPPPPAPLPAIEVPTPAKHEGPQEIGEFTITFYYMIGEEDLTKPANSNEELVQTLYDPDRCEPIADVSYDFAEQLALQGTGKLRDGRVLNVWSHCKCGHGTCFKETKNPWGNAGTGRALQPFRTVAVDPKVVKLGTLLYVPLLEGRRMPGRDPWGGFVHDGCVVADDTGGFGGNKLDLFVGRKGYFLGLSGSQSSHAWARHVPVYDGSERCQRKGRKIGRKTAAS